MSTNTSASGNKEDNSQPPQANHEPTSSTREESSSTSQQQQQSQHGRPQSAHSTHSSHSSSSSSKHVKCIGRYVLTGHNLGKGNFARVEAAVHTLTRAKVAIKIIETDKIKEEYVRKNLLREAQLMRRLRHPNIIRLYETMKTNNLYCLVTEIAEGGELLSHVRNDFKEKRLPEATTRPFIRQLTSALFYLHSHGIVHRDLKMENILLDKKKRYVKIVDFGLSNAQKAGALLQTHCGSPEYAAPELFIPGRQYGPEVDVWSLGVNMYAMLVGKLPFRSPRQGTKKRQKLLEQISAGITEHHEKEMEHVSTSACDLICRLLQPDSSRRATLDDVMHHPWTTKDGTHPLTPYEYAPPDPITQNMVIDLMQKVLSETSSQIRETVKRDRCDWLAAIYNLLMDQPEGRNVLQRMVTADPIDKFVGDADYQASSAEHLSLSQGYSATSQQSQDSIDLLTKPVFPLTHDRHRRHRDDDHQHQTTDLDVHLSKNDRRKHPTVDQRTLGQLRGHVHSQTAAGYGLHSSHAGRRVGVVDHSPLHAPIPSELGGVMKRHHAHHRDDMEGYAGQLEPPNRPHSRMSAPEPLPIPFQLSMLPKNMYNHTPSPNEQSPAETPPPILTPRSPDHALQSAHVNSSQENSPYSSAKVSARRRGSANLKPVMRKTLSASHDIYPEGGGALMMKGNGKSHSHHLQAQMQRRLSADRIHPPVGWGSGNPQFAPPNQRMRLNGPADIQSLMSGGDHSTGSTANPTQRSILDTNDTASGSMELKPELFLTNRMKRGSSAGGTTPPPSKNETATEGLKIDMTPIIEPAPHRRRSSSAKNPAHLSNNMLSVSSHTASAKHLGDPTLNGLKVPAHRELPSLSSKPVIKGDKISPGPKRKSFGGFFVKALRSQKATPSSGDDTAALTVHGSTPNGMSSPDIM